MPLLLSRLVVGTAGHIDHGKSALVKALTGTDPDRLKEEQARGITIDLGFAHATIGGVTIAFVDVPGHERFVRNMLAGAGGIDAVLLVVAADESVMPQTREHFQICRLLGLSRGLIVLTKCDLADETMQEIAAAEARALVEGSALEGAPIVRVSARTGQGLDALRAALPALAGDSTGAARSGAARLPVDRAFTMKGFGTVVTGTLVSGEVAVEDHLAVLPAGGRARVRGLQVHGETVARAVAPSRVAINLAGVSIDEVARGVTLAGPDSLVTTRRADARIEVLTDAAPLKHGARVRVFQGTSDVAARLALSVVRRGPDDVWHRVAPGETASIPAGGEAFVRLRFERPVVLARRDRFVLRVLTPASTIGGGVVIDPQPPAAGLRRPPALDRFLRIDLDSAAMSSDERCARVWIAESGMKGVSSQELAARGGLAPEAASALLSTLESGGVVRLIDGRAYDAALVESIAARTRNALAAFHAAHPDEAGMPYESVREQVTPRAAAALFSDVAAALLTSGALTGTDRLRLVSHAPGETPERARIASAAEARVGEAGLTAPDGSTLAAALQVPAAELEHVLRTMVRDGRLIKIGTLFFHPAALARLRDEIRAMRSVAPEGPAKVDVATFKQRYGLTRKHAIPLLEWLDRQRVTRRVGDTRIVV